MEHSTTAVLSTVIASSPKPTFKNPGDVDFEVKYPEDYGGPRHMPEGVVTISKESAEQFTKLGIGKVVQAAAPAAEGSKGDSESKNDKKKGK
jgi:hypothetical protein